MLIYQKNGNKMFTISEKIFLSQFSSIGEHFSFTHIAFFAIIKTRKFAFFPKNKILTKGAVIMPKSNHAFFRPSTYSRIPAYMLKLGMLLISLYTASVYIAVEINIVKDPLGVMLEYIPAVEQITLSTLWLVGGTILLDRLFRKL